jgi:3-oxoacyl-[acyl-carrier protein] reductase
MLPVSDVVDVVEAVLGLSSRAMISNVILSRAGTDGRRV